MTNITELVLGEGVYSIGDYAFAGIRISNLVLPKSLGTTIGDTKGAVGSYAFANITTLKTLDIKGQIIGHYMFYRNTALATVTYDSSNSLDYIGYYAFYKDIALTTFTYLSLIHI